MTGYEVTVVSVLYVDDGTAEFDVTVVEQVGIDFFFDALLELDELE